MLRKLGKGMHVSSATGRLIVEAQTVEYSQSYCVDSTGFVIGRVDEFFGPCTKPFAAVKTGRGVDPRKYVGQQLFLASPRNTGRRGGGGHRLRRHWERGGVG
ncbi:MAG: hypothetical protein M1357_00075 [Candidatus Marsarchaeota archaeon]|nr:hypothetical protein [Candidatus Marsarchaeota archaeon]